ncbi:MAG: TAXI family TRAP transporter solute-binding subunit [Acidobacteriota bacterium]
MKFEDATKGFIDLLQKKTTRYTIAGIAVTISVMMYVYVVEIYDPNKNLITQLWRSVVNTSYHFYSGGPGGFYIQIGDLLQAETARRSGMKILNNQSEGGVDNAIKVASSGSAFGLAQEDSIPEGDFILDQVRFITPLYLEHIHILYRHNRVSELLGADPEDIPEILEIFPSSAESSSDGTDSQRDLVRRFFEKATVSTGPHRSGSRIISSYLLEEMGVKVHLDLNLGLQAALERLISEEVNNGQGLDIVMWITGGPLESVAQTLEKHPDIRLMGINPTFAPSLNRRFNLKLRPATFRGIYTQGEQISTIGSYSFLICSKDVPNFAIMELLEVLDGSKEKIRGRANNANFQLNQFDFLAFFRQRHNGYLVELIRNILIFISSVTLTTAGVMSFLVWLASNLKQVAYFREITQIYKERLPDNTALDEGVWPFPKPSVQQNQGPAIAGLVEGTRGLLKMARVVRGDYRSGGISATHQRHLLENINHLIGIFQRNLCQRLAEVIQRGGELSEPLTEEFIRQYYTAGYLRRGEHLYLIRLLRGEGTMHPILVQELSDS